MAATVSRDELFSTVSEQFEAVLGVSWEARESSSPREPKAETIEDTLNLYRNLMSLMKFKHESSTLSAISDNLTYLLMQKEGLLHMITATVDIDDTSQLVTSHDQRYAAVGQVVAFPPTICCPLRVYYANIVSQIFALLTKTSTAFIKEKDKLVAVRKIATAVASCLIARNKKLGNMFILKPLNDAWLDPKSSMKVQEAIQIMYGLVVCRFDVSSFLPFFGAIFSARCTLETHVSHYKSYLDEIITEITSKTKHSHHLLDDALFVNQNIPTYQTTEDEENILIIATATEEAVNVKHVDNVVQVSLRYLANFKASLKVDFFLMLLEHLSYTHLYTSKQNLILYSLIDSVNETVCDNIVEYPEKCISFVVTVLERSANEISKSSFSLNESPSSENEVLSTLNEDTKLVALQIVSVLLNEKDKLTTQHVQSLKQCIRSLNLLIANESDTTEKSRLMSICDQLISMENPKYSVKSASRFHQAMKDLNDAIMPTRAHALVELKRLIFAKDAETLAHQNDLVALLTVCLSDSESYIYLSAINTLAALATVNVHDILPLLANAFLSDNRTVQERVNVAEVIVQLSKRLGEMAPHYADDFINCLMAGLTSHEATIRISSLSCLGQFCALLKFSLRKYIIQVMGAVTSLLKTDSVLEVKRACLMWIHLVLNGLDKTSLEALGPELITMYRIVKHNYEHCLDDVMRLHSQLALEQLDQLAKEMLSPDIPMRKKIEILS